MSRTRFYTTFRVSSASVALGMAAGWTLDRIEALGSLFSGVENAAIDHSWWVVFGLA